MAPLPIHAQTAAEHLGVRYTVDLYGAFLAVFWMVATGHTAVHKIIERSSIVR